MKLFSERIPPSKPFDGKVAIKNGYLISKGEQENYDCKFSIAELTAAYLVINKYHLVFLTLLCPGSQNYIPITYEGFSKVYATLSQKFGFDDDLFFRHKGEGVALKGLLWRGKQKANYKLLEGTFSDITKGFEIQSPEKIFISWDMPLGELKRQKHVMITKTDIGNEELIFAYPVRMGNLLLDNLTGTLYKDRPDVPVKHLQMACFDVSNSDKSLTELENYFQQVSSHRPASSYNNRSQKRLTFELNGMQFGLYYIYDWEYQFESGSTKLWVENRREYPHLLIDETYEKRGNADEVIELKGNITTDIRYKENPRIKRMPPFIAKKYGNGILIWRDDINQKIGFGSGKYAQVFDEQEIKKNKIANVLPAKGGGYAELHLKLTGREFSSLIYTADCYGFDEYAEEIAGITGKKVEYERDSMDC